MVFAEFSGVVEMLDGVRAPLCFVQQTPVTGDSDKEVSMTARRQPPSRCSSAIFQCQHACDGVALLAQAPFLVRAHASGVGPRFFEIIFCSFNRKLASPDCRSDALLHPRM